MVASFDLVWVRAPIGPQKCPWRARGLFRGPTGARIGAPYEEGGAGGQKAAEKAARPIFRGFFPQGRFVVHHAPKSRGKITAVHHAQKKPRKNHRGAPHTKKAAEKSPRCTTQKKPRKNHRGAPHTKKATEKSPRCTTQKCCKFFF